MKCVCVQCTCAIFCEFVNFGCSFYLLLLFFFFVYHTYLIIPTQPSSFNVHVKEKREKREKKKLKGKYELEKFLLLLVQFNYFSFTWLLIRFLFFYLLFFVVSRSVVVIKKFSVLCAPPLPQNRFEK